MGVKREMSGILDSNDVIRLVGITPVYLNKFVERRLYGIVPSERADVGRGGRRWFNDEDVYGIALVWWLFEAGLRSDVIRRVLRDLCGQANANKAAKVLYDENSEFLVICRTPRSSSKKRRKGPSQKIDTANKSDLLDLIESMKDETLHIIPVGRLFDKLEQDWT